MYIYYYNQVVSGTYSGKVCPSTEHNYLEIFVVWTGTDSNGNRCTSAGSRFSRFNQYGGKKMYEDLLDDLKPEPPTTASSS